MSAAMTKGVLELRRFNATDFAGAKLALAGTLSGVTEGRIDALQGQLKGNLAAAKTDGLLDFFGVKTAGLEGAAQLASELASGQAVDSDAKLATITVKGTLGSGKAPGGRKGWQSREI